MFWVTQKSGNCTTLEVCNTLRSWTTFCSLGEENLKKGNQPASPFDMFFGGGGGQGGRRKGQNFKMEFAGFAFCEWASLFYLICLVSLEELYNGAEKEFKINRKVLCNKCRGTGAKGALLLLFVWVHVWVWRLCNDRDNNKSVGGETVKCKKCQGRGVVVRLFWGLQASRVLFRCNCNSWVLASTSRCRSVSLLSLSGRRWPPSTFLRDYYTPRQLVR